MTSSHLLLSATAIVADIKLSERAFGGSTGRLIRLLVAFVLALEGFCLLWIIHKSQVIWTSHRRFWKLVGAALVGPSRATLVLVAVPRLS